jgi:hypothetical protein
MWDVRIEGLNELNGITNSGEFQRVVIEIREEEKNPGTVLPMFGMSADGGAVDILISILRDCMVNQKTLIKCSFQVMRLCSSALSNLIEYINPSDTASPRAIVSRAAMSRLMSVDGIKTLTEVSLMALCDNRNTDKVLIDDRENSPTFKSQLANDILRALLASIRHLIQLATNTENAEDAEDAIKVFRKLRPLLANVLIACNSYEKDAIIVEMTTLLTNTVVKMITAVP